MNRKTLLILSLVLAHGSTAAVAQPGPTQPGRHDMLLLLPAGPLHMRIRITDGGKPLQQIRREYMEQLVASLDIDGDEKLSRDETAKHPLFVGGRSFAGNAFLESLRPRKPYSEREIELAIDRAAGQLLTFRQNNTLADQDLSVFHVLDENQSGMIDAAEMRLAPARIAARDLDFDQCVTFDEFLDEPEETLVGLPMTGLGDEAPGAIHSELLRDAREPILAARLVRHYDADRDAHLTARELRWPLQRADALDRDGDGLLNMEELSMIGQTGQPDVSLEVDIGQPASSAMRLTGPQPPDVSAVRADLVRLTRGGVTLSVGYRHHDPVEEARQNAAATFNAIDMDANGYLDREEIAGHQRFERYLFDAMDADEDQRLFADEMLSYVQEYTNPASTSCQVTLLDTGNGFFQMLDHNADGRVSIRELRACEQTLSEVAGNEPAINPSRLTKAYRIEIVRGGVSLFGRVDRPSAETPAALLKPPSGPVWFQRMDRNGDGDLTWNEFLGPRDVFHRIDADHDGLIDQSEATQANEEAQ